MLDLQMQAAQRPLERAAVIVLAECRFDTGLREFLRLPGFHEKSARIAEYLRLDQDHVGDGSFLKFHGAARITAAFAL